MATWLVHAGESISTAIAGASSGDIIELETSVLHKITDSYSAPITHIVVNKDLTIQSDTPGTRAELTGEDGLGDARGAFSITAGVTVTFKDILIDYFNRTDTVTFVMGSNVAVTFENIGSDSVYKFLTDSPGAIISFTGGLGDFVAESVANQYFFDISNASSFTFNADYQLGFFYADDFSSTIQGFIHINHTDAIVVFNENNWIQGDVSDNAYWFHVSAGNLTIKNNRFANPTVINAGMDIWNGRFLYIDGTSTVNLQNNVFSTLGAFPLATAPFIELDANATLLIENNTFNFKSIENNYALLVKIASNNLLIRNNIFTGCLVPAIQLAVEFPINETNNCYYPVAGEPIDFVATNPVLSDPILISNLDWHLDTLSPCIDTGSLDPRVWPSPVWFTTDGYNESITPNVVDTGMLDLGYHYFNGIIPPGIPPVVIEPVEYPWVRYTFTSAVQDFTASMDTTFSSYLTRFVGSLTYNNLVTELSLQPLTAITSQIISGFAYISHYPDHSLKGFTLVDSSGNYAIIDDNAHNILTTNITIAGLSQPLRLEEAQIAWSGTFQPDISGAYWFPIYDTYSRFLTGTSGIIDNRYAEINLASGVSNPNPNIGRGFQSRIDMYIPSGARGNFYDEFELIQGETYPGIQIKILDWENNLYKVTHSNNDGRFSVNVRPGQYKLHFQGKNFNHEDWVETFNAGHGHYMSQFGDDYFESITQIKEMIAVAEIGSIEFGQFLIFENFLNNSGRSLEPEPGLSGLVLEGLWGPFLGSGISYVDWSFSAMDPTVVATATENNSYYTRPIGPGGLNPGEPEQGPME